MRNTAKNKEQGMAFLFAMIALMAILALLSLIGARLIAAKNLADHAYRDALLEEAVKGGIDIAIERLWNDYVAWRGETTGTWSTYRQYLDSVLNIPNTEDVNGNGVQDPGEYNINGRNGWETWPASYQTYGYPLLSSPYTIQDPESGRTLVTIESIHVVRTDTIASSSLTIRVAANVEGKRKVGVQKLYIGGQPFSGAQFAVLANNISCLLCHADIRSLPLDRNTDPLKYNTFDRLKVASLESMLVRQNQAYSYIAGTLYTRGRVYKENGSQYSAAELASDTLFKAYQFNPSNGKIVQTATGAMVQVPFVNAGTDSNGHPLPMANLYLQYPTDEAAQKDGLVPNSFPAPFPDENNNRIVDDDEFETVVNSANGYLTFLLPPEEVGGSVTAGVAYGVPRGSVYSGTGLPSSSNDALSQLQSSGAYDGNLILVGTDADPIVIQDRVAVNGDLVIKGPVKGRGQLLVRGNVYVVGDVTYADAPGQYGQDAEGNENLFSIVAGGSMLMGDYLTIRGVNHSANNNQKYPNWSQYSIHMRDANRTNTVTISGKTESLKWGYFDPWSVDPGGIVSGKPGQQFSFTTSELMLFNKMEVERAVADPNYVPRFYGLRESQPDKVYVYDAADEHSVRYSESGVKLLTNYLTSKGYPLSILTRATYHYLNPQGNWISESTLRNIWYADELSRPSAGRPFKFDGLLYSNNAIFQIVRSYTRHYSNTKGKMQIRGAVIAADLGVFVPEGFTLSYDERVKYFLGVYDASTLTVKRQAFYYVVS